MDIVKLKDLTVDGKRTYGVAAPAVEYQENLCLSAESRKASR